MTAIEAGDRYLQKTPSTKIINGLTSLDFYVIGELWIAALQSALVGVKWRPMPTVHAAPPPKPPECPPKMKYKDLSIYQSPHYEYKEHVADKERCPKYNEKLIHNYLLPYVRDGRRTVQKSYKDYKKQMQDTYCSIMNGIESTKCSVKKFMRCPDNLTLRRGVVATGGLAGLFLARNKGLLKRIIYVTTGALLTGSLCFPEETDEVFRDGLSRTGKALAVFYNLFCNKNFEFREAPCDFELTPPSKEIKEICPKKVK